MSRSESRLTEAAVAELGRNQFPGLDRVCFNAARWHPLPKVAVDAVTRHAIFRAADGSWEADFGSLAQSAAKAGFARLISADVDDIALIPSTTVAEQLVVRSLGLPSSGGILTDLMHYDGSIYFYDMLSSQGADVCVVEPSSGKIQLADLEARLARGGVTLVAVSGVSNMTGHAHDLPALTALAHRYGALVYADIIQMAGAVPFDVGASGVDFCACSGFKWLMGEMGLGFLYVRPTVRDRLIHPIRGDRQLVRDMLPWPPTGPRDWEISDKVAGLFEAASLPVGVAVSLEASIGLISSIGVERIAAYRAPLLARIGQELPPLGYRRVTPDGSIAPFLVFDLTGRRDTSERLRAANINAAVMGNVLRIAVSIFNSDDDVDRLVAALAL